MPTFEDLQERLRSTKPDPKYLQEDEDVIDETTVPVEERPPTPYIEGTDISVSKLLEQNAQIQVEQDQDRLDESLTSEQWFGYALGTTVELTAPIASNIAYAKWLARARAASKVAKPFKATPVGMIGFGAAEITVGALSNYANQEIKRQFKAQEDGIRISELMAAGVFNATPIVNIVDGLPVFKFLQPPLGKKITPKIVTINGVKSFVSGATIGALESSFRQSVSMLLDEPREGGFDYTDLAFSTGVGGTLNTALRGGVGLFSYWRSKGKWGREQAVKVTDLMDGNLVKQIDDINKEIQQEADDVGIFTNFAKKNAKIAELKKQRKQIEEAKELNQQLKKEIQEENARVDEAEANPKPIEEPGKLTEEELEAPDEKLREVEEEVVEEPKAVVEEAAVEAEAPKVEEPTPKPKPLKRDGVLQSLVDRTRAAFSTGKPPTIEGPNIERDAKKLYSDSSSIFSKAINTFRESDGKEIRALEVALDEVVFIRDLNRKVIDPLDTLYARGLQSARKDAAKYNYETVLSERAGAEEDAWMSVEKALRQAIDNDANVELYKAVDDALSVRPRFKELGEQFDRKATADYKRKLREATTKEPKEVPQELIISRLQQKLREAQQEFAGLKPEAKAKKAREKSEKEIDIQNRLDFYATGKREAKQIAQEENRLETYLELLEEGDIDKIRQQLGPAPDWTNKKAVGSYLATIRKVNNKTKKLLQKQVVESDISLQDPNKVAKAEAKKKARLQKRLKELRARAFQIEKIRPKDKAAKAEVNAEIEELERTVKFHEANERDALKLEAAYKERARLLKVETGPLGAQRAEVTKLKGPTKVPGELEKVNKDIAFLKSNMRKRVDDIDKARLEMTQEFQEAKMLEAIRKRRELAEKRLEQRRKRFADDYDLDKRAAERAGRKPEETDPILLEYQDKIKFYDAIEAEALRKKELREELAKRAEMEARGVVSEMREHLAPKPTGPKKIRSTDQIEKEIRASDKRMRDKLKDFDKAVDKMREERIYEATKKQAIAAAQADVETKVSRFLRQWGNNRVYAMIWQTSSVLASALGGIASSFKQFTKIGAEPIADMMVTKGYSGSQISSYQTLKANFYGLREALKNWKGTGRAVALTAKNLESATGAAGANRLTGDISFGDPIRLLEAAEESARRKRLRGETVTGVQHVLARLPLGKMFNEFMKLPLRGIMPIDEGFRRQLLRAELMSEAWKDAFNTHPKDPKKAAELATELYKQKWTKDQGLEILSEEGVNATATDTINKELLFDSNVANLDETEIAQPIADKVLRFVKELKMLEDTPAAGALIHLLAPIMTVVARGAGRSIRVGVPIIPAAQAARNPYNKKIKKARTKIREKNDKIGNKETTPDRRVELSKEVDELETKIKELKGRRIAYHRDAITDTLLGTGMMSLGYALAASGIAVGSLSWMNQTQRERFQHKNPKAKQNTIEGWGYRELFPLSMAFAIGADWAMYDEMKEFQDESGKPILTDDQSRLTVMLNSMKDLFKEVPVAGGMKSVERLFSGDDNLMTGVLVDWLASFALVPSQINKVLKLYFEKGSVEELRGGSWQDRLAYKVTGNHPAGNKKTDHFGYDLPSPKTPLQTFIRWAPDRSVELNEFDVIYKKDIEGEGQLVKPPKEFPVIRGIDMYKFVDNNGTSLKYRFDQELRKTEVDKQVIEMIKTTRWQDSYKEGSKPRKGTADPTSVANPALQKINDKLNKAYNKTARNIIKNIGNTSGTHWLDEFISEEENEEGTLEYEKYGPRQTLRQVIDSTKGKSITTGEPIAVEEILNRNDLDELLKDNPQLQLLNQ
jgi:hypothetical protein